MNIHEFEKSHDSAKSVFGNKDQYQALKKCNHQSQGWIILIANSRYTDTACPAPIQVSVKNFIILPHRFLKPLSYSHPLWPSVQAIRSLRMESGPLPVTVQPMPGRPATSLVTLHRYRTVPPTENASMHTPTQACTHTHAFSEWPVSFNRRQYITIIWSLHQR